MSNFDFNFDAELRERKQELDALWNKGMKEEDPWKAQIIAQEWKRKKSAYDRLMRIVEYV